MVQERDESRLLETLHIANYLALARRMIGVYTLREAETYARRKVAVQKATRTREGMFPLTQVEAGEMFNSYFKKHTNPQTLERLNQLAVNPESTNQIIEALNQMLSTLTPREKRVVEARYGLSDGQVRTRKEVGTEFNIGKERIRQIEVRALRKLRHPFIEDGRDHSIFLRALKPPPPPPALKFAP